MKRGVLGLICIPLLSCGRPEAPSAPAPAPPPAVAAPHAYPRYNELVQKSSHNAYDDKPSLEEQLEKYRIRSLEIDIHHSLVGVSAPKDDFLVYHATASALGTSCAEFSKCLGHLATWHEKHPNHEVATIFIDLKDPWTPDHNEASLDRQLEARLAKAIFTPGDLTASCSGAPTPRDAVTKCGWPTTHELRGRFLFAITGGSGHLEAYAHRANARAFIAPEPHEAAAISKYTDAVFFNLNTMKLELADAVHDAGLVSRVYWAKDGKIHGVNDAEDWAAALAHHANHIATDAIDPAKSPFASTANAHGWPFGCQKTDCRNFSEDER